jgi:hypothetical protein
MALVPADNSKKRKLMTDLAREWKSGQKEVNDLLSIQDRDLRDKLVEGLTQLAVDISVYNPPKSLWGRMTDVLYMDPGVPEQKKLTFITKVIKNLANPKALSDLDTSRLSAIEDGVSVVSEVKNMSEWVAARIDAKEPFAKDPGFCFDFNFDAIDYAVKGYIRSIDAGMFEMPNYHNLCQEIKKGRVESAKSEQFLMDVVDGKVDPSVVREKVGEILQSLPVRTKPLPRGFGDDLGL